MKILITGGNSLTGYHLVRRLLKEGHLVTLIDSRPVTEALASLKNIAYYQLAASDPKNERIFADSLFDFVVHQPENEPDPAKGQAAAQILQDNQAGLANILALSLHYQVRKLVYLSSYQVYGQQESLPVEESARPGPASLAGLHYQTQEMQCQQYRQLGLNVLVLRTAHIIGTQPGSPPRLALQSLIETAFSSYGRDGLDLDRLDLIYVSDVAEAILLGLEKETSPVLNIASGLGSTRQQLAQTCCAVFSELYAAQPDAFSGQDYDPAAVLDSYCQPYLPKEEKEPDLLLQPSSILSIRLARQELGWEPKFSLFAAVHKTLSWCFKAMQNSSSKKDPAEKPRQLGSWLKRMPRTGETLLLGLLAFLLTYLSQYQLAINADLFLLYIALTGLFYGLGQGVLATSWAVLARVFFLLVLDRQPATFLTMSVDLVIQISLYILLGVSIGYAAEARTSRQESLSQELAKVKDELSFTNILYLKNLEIKKKLQAVIESNENSLGRLIHLFSRLEKADLESAYSEIANILVDILKVGTVMVYSTDAPGNWFRLIAHAGPASYLASFQAKQYDFLAETIKKRQLYINTGLRQGYPLLCVPLFVGDMLEAVLFIDGIDFINLTQHFLNTLKALVGLLSISIEQKYQLENKISSDKFIDGTAIVQKDWFARIAQNLRRQTSGNTILFKIEQGNPASGQLRKVVPGLVRPADLVGELPTGQLGIIMLNLPEHNLDQVKNRFARRGLALTPADWKEEFTWPSS